MIKARRKFDKDFKRQAVEMVLKDGLSKAEVGRRLGVHEGQISNWVRIAEQNGVVAFPGNGKLKPQDEELRRLRRENDTLRQELEFLKKSAIYFASLKK